MQFGDRPARTREYEGVEYSDFWASVDRQKLNELEHAIISELLPASGCRVIDIGCGFGRLSDCYLGRFQEAVMLDGSMSLLRQAQQETDARAVYLAADVEHLPFQPASFDAAVMIRVFHHMPDSRACLSEVRRILASNGCLVFNYSNKRHVIRVLKRVIGRSSDDPFSPEPILFEKGLYGHHPRFMAEVLAETGFTEVVYRGAGISDKVAGKLGTLGSRLPPGARLAPVLGATKISPLVFCGATADGREPFRSLAVGRVTDLLACPACGADVVEEAQAYECRSCRHRYPIVEGIIDFRIT